MTSVTRMTRAAAFTAVMVGIMFASASGQKAKPKAAAAPKTVVFAVLNDGKVLEPIGYVANGKITAAVDAAAEAAAIRSFHRSYYKPSSSYKLVFGGVHAGSVAVRSADASAECTRHTAQAEFTSAKARLRGNVMALATTSSASLKGSGIRRLPTAAERSEIETAVREYLLTQKVSSTAVKNLKYHNLTALDLDTDGTAEFVGTFWVDVSSNSRALLFFIAERSGAEKYSFGFTDFRLIDQKDVMSGEISSVDGGVYHERLLDVLDIDGDGVSEVFTYIQSFEGAGFNVYRRQGAGKWVNVFEGSNYHCGF
jgi:hypothetical protein